MPAPRERLGIREPAKLRDPAFSYPRWLTRAGNSTQGAQAPLARSGAVPFCQVARAYPDERNQAGTSGMNFIAMPFMQ